MPVDWKKREGGFPRKADLVSKIRDWQLGRQRVTVAQKTWVWMQTDRTSRGQVVDTASAEPTHL